MFQDTRVAGYQKVKSMVVDCQSFQAMARRLISENSMGGTSELSQKKT